MRSACGLRQELADLGVRSGMDLLVHSSLKRLGPVDGGADSVIDVLLELLGPDGTLLMPTHTWDVVSERQPVFHVAKTPSHVGVLTERFRTRPGVARSLHPTHSVAAAGARAGFYLAGHLANASRVPPESPYGRLMRRGGWILLLCVGMSSNTCIHGIEEEAGCSPLLADQRFGLYSIDTEGTMHASPLCRHRDIGKRHYPAWMDLEHELSAAGILRFGRTGNGVSRLIDAAAMREYLLPIFRDHPERMFLGIEASGGDGTARDETL